MTFDIIGDVAVISEREDIDNIVEEIKKTHKHVKTICIKKGKIQGEERIPKIEVMWGDGTETIHKENGFRFKLDVKKVFYTPRMQNERAIVISKVRSNERVLDMFAGVGPFAIPIAKKAKQVVAIDINKHAIKYLKENAKLNKVNVKTYVGDCREIIRKENLTEFDRIIMNFPKGAKEYLDVALKAGRKGTIIHFYTFEKQERMKFSEDFEVLERRTCGDVAPGLFRVAYDLKIK